jgi:hypothetical protein
LHFRIYPLTPALSPKGGEGGREPIFMLSKNQVRLRKRKLICAVSRLEFGAMFQVGVTRINNSVSPLSLWERARVRGFWRYTQATLLTSIFEPENRWSFIDWASKVAAGL